MSQVKEFKVSLTPVDEKVLNPGTRTRKRRTSTKATGGAELEGVNLVQSLPVPNLPIEPAPASETTTQAWLPTANTVPSTMPNLSGLTTAHVGPTAADISLNAGPPMTGGIRLGAKKHSTLPIQNGTHTNKMAHIGAAKILATKKKPGVVPLTRKKPKLMISGGGAGVNGSNVPTMSNVAKSVSATAENIAQNGGAGAATRKFKERRISIDVRPGTRSAGKKIRERVAGMSAVQIKRTLIRKGVLKANGKTPPEAMMRAMLRDYMLLHTAA
jgi:hypothetical protein